jgi:anti-sigma-K factor RskA
MARPETDEEREGLAAEYVLRTLTHEEHVEAERLIAEHPEFALAVARWEERLSPLAAAVEPAQPPPELLERIVERLDSPRVIGRGEVVALKRRVRIWQGASAAAAALAAALAVAILLDDGAPELSTRYVAALQAGGDSPAFVAVIDVAKGTMAVRQVGAASPEPGRSYELWAIGGGRQQPQSLGLIDASARIPAELLAKPDSSALDETVLAVSLEPKGGSPTGQPTGPVLFTGRLVPAD